MSPQQLSARRHFRAGGSAPRAIPRQVEQLETACPEEDIDVGKERLIGVHRRELDLDLDAKDAPAEQTIGAAQDLELAALGVELDEIRGLHGARGQRLFQRCGANASFALDREQRRQLVESGEHPAVRPEQR